ncbi:carbohydrate ABC transporter permease [Paenibacillus sp. GCM10023252]|uniref:carbohydrate ABC transporter permease n=1 Tax=Paenibacillus sp. GCM10023252 TaxID=3252649 RepID=UPI00361A7D93
MTREAKIINVFMTIVSILIVLPILLMLAISFTDEQTLRKNGFEFIPEKLSFEGYSMFWQAPEQLIKAYGVTIFVTVAGTLLGLLLTTMTAYAISRQDYKLRKSTTFYIFFTMMFSGGLVPSYILITQYLHMKDTIWVMIIPALLSPFLVMIMKGFLSKLPFEVFESAKMDGAGEWRIFFTIVLPLSLPALATVAVILSFQYWNDYMLAFLYVENKDLTPVQLMLVRILDNINFLKENAFQGQVDIKIKDLPTMSTRMALTVLIAGPMLLVFPFFQRFFIKGLTIGSLK